MEENRFYILGSKKIAGELTKEEATEWEMILLRNPLYQEIFNSLQTNLPSVGHQQTESPRILDNLRKKIATIDPTYIDAQNNPAELPEPGNGALSKTKILSYAALLCMIILAIFLYAIEQRPLAHASLPANNIITRPGSKTQITLPDGSTVILNADSKLSYPDNFIGDTREVTLEGEAFFEVTENKKRPFIIHSRAMDIKVLGTVFNVKAYPKETISEAALLKGSIEVTLKNRTNNKIMLKPSEKIRVTQPVTIDKPVISQEKQQDDTGSLVSIEKIAFDRSDNAADETAWTTNKLVFSNETLEELAGKLERWYGRKLVIQNEQLKELRFTGRFYNESILQVLKALQLTADFKFKFNKDEILIW